MDKLPLSTYISCKLRTIANRTRDLPRPWIKLCVINHMMINALHIAPLHFPHTMMAPAGGLQRYFPDISSLTTLTMSYILAIGLQKRPGLLHVGKVLLTQRAIMVFAITKILNTVS